jgi:hypothetical protein
MYTQVNNLLKILYLICKQSLVEIEVFLRSSDHCFIALIEILLSDHVSIFTNGLHTSLLAYTCDVCRTDLIRPTNILFQIDIF